MFAHDIDLLSAIHSFSLMLLNDRDFFHKCYLKFSDEFLRLWYFLLPYGYNRISGIIGEEEKEAWTINPPKFNPRREPSITSIKPNLTMKKKCIFLRLIV